MYTRLTVYPSGEPIPESLPESYQPAGYITVPVGQNCLTCKALNLDTKICSKWNAPVKYRWWCAAWQSRNSA